MRYCIVVLLVLSLAAPASTLAQGTSSSFLQLSHPVLKSGQIEGLTVGARDLQGRPLVGASVSATIHYGSKSVSFKMPATDKNGRSFLSFHPPTGVSAPMATVSVEVSNGYLDLSLAGSFKLSGFSSKSGTTSKPGKPQPKAKLVLVSRALPPTVTAPEPVWIVVYVRTSGGVDLRNAPVDAAAVFKGATARANAHTDGYGVATIRIDTSSARANQTVQVGIVAHWSSLVASSTAQFTVRIAPQPTPTTTPTTTPTATPTPTPTLTATPNSVPTATDVPANGFVLPTSTPTATAVDTTPTATSAPTPTSTPVATATSTPTATLVPTVTPIPTPTDTPTATSTPTETSTPTPTSTPVPTCPGSDTGCMQAELNLINTTRQQHGLPAYSLNMTQSMGTGNCIGSLGHSQHMAQTNSLAHDQFPSDICVGANPAGENIGKWTSGNELTDLQDIHSLMMSEPWSPGCQGNHACNILSSQFHQVGIGIVYVNGTTWMTTDFLG